MGKLLNFIPIKVSAKWCRIRFIQCGPECFEKKGCHGICCDPHKNNKDGPRVYVTTREAKAIKDKYDINSTSDGFLIPKKGCNLCPFKGETYECNLHYTNYKPLGCIVSPFAINKNNTLIIKHRYIHLPCRDDSGRPAYKTFRESLLVLFGDTQVNKLTNHLDNGRGDLTLKIKKDVYKNIVGRERSLKKLK